MQVIALFLLLAAFPVKNVRAAGWLCYIFNSCGEKSAEIGAVIAFDPRYRTSSVEDIKKNNEDLLINNRNSLTKTSFLSNNLNQSEENGADTEKSITVYTVKKGDNLYDIADYFGISLNTILWANGLSGRNPVIRPGDKLTILPISGLRHKVRRGETLSLIARKYFKSSEYKEGLRDIIEFNGLSEEGLIKQDQILIIPGGKKPIVSQRRYASSARTRKTTKIRNLGDYFGWPIPSAIVKFTRRYEPHLRYGVDMGSRIDNASCLNADGSKTPIFAAADGIVTTVVQSKSRWRGGYGNYIVIKHPNNTVTYYAHLYYGSILVKRGEQVLKGQRIASMGGGFEYFRRGRYRMKGAGTSTGCHLHFEVRGAVNPFVAIRRTYP